MFQRLHHVAYRCLNAAETVDFYTKLLGLKFAKAIVQDYVPSIKAHYPHTHIFFEMEDGSSVAFFEVPESPEMGFDPNTPDWVQHLALRVGSMDELLAAKKRLQDMGIEVLGPADHKICQSIYFHDPSGHRLELAYPTETPQMVSAMQNAAETMLNAWDKTKRAVPNAI